MKILFIRHAQSTANIADALDTAAPGAPLSALGRQQAAALPSALADAGMQPVEAVYASPLTRTQQTAEPLARSLGMPIRVHAGLQEVLAGDLEGRSDSTSIAQYLSVARAWTTGDLAAALPRGESGHDVLRRMDGVVTEVVSSAARSVAIVSHGCAIWTWVKVRATNVGDAFGSPHLLSNTGVIALEGDFGQGWRVSSWEGTVLRDPGLVDTDHDGPASALWAQ